MGNAYANLVVKWIAVRYNVGTTRNVFEVIFARFKTEKIQLQVSQQVLSFDGVWGYTALVPGVTVFHGTTSAFW